MAARRAAHLARQASNKEAEDDAHAKVDVAKRALGERGPVWWDDGASDLNRIGRATRHMPPGSSTYDGSGTGSF